MEFDYDYVESFTVRPESSTRISRTLYYEGVVIDLIEGGHIMYINPGSVLKIWEDKNEGIIHVHDGPKPVFTLKKNDISDYHWLPRQGG